MINIKKILVLCLSFCWSISAFSQPDSLFADMEISLLTCKSGDEVYTTFGHTAIRLNNTMNKSDIVYNYGTFDFNAPYFFIKFLRGQLPYRLSASSMSRFLREYNHERRSVIEQKLDLSADQKKQLFKALAANFKPENAEYQYDFFFDNCTTRTIDKIEETTGAISFENEIADITFRQMLKQNLKSMPWSEFGIDLIIGAIADKKTNRKEQHFLPMYLHNDLNDAKDTAGKSIVNTDYLVLDFEAEDAIRQSPSQNWPLYMGILLVLLELMLFFKLQKTFFWYDKMWMWLMSIMGIIMAFMWFGTDHGATKQNYNLLWANILFLVFLRLRKTAIGKWTAYIIIGTATIALINSIVQILPQYFLPVFGCFATVSILKLVRYIRNYKEA